MTGKEIIKKVIEFDSPPRIGLDFCEPHQKDIAWILAAKLVNKKYESCKEWGVYPGILSKVPGFKGEVCIDAYGNIYGRLNRKTKGECIKGALEDGWDFSDSFQMPEVELDYDRSLNEKFRANEGRFLLAAMPVAVFSTLRDLRKIDNALMDTVLEKNMVLKFLEKIAVFAESIIKRSAENGFNGVIVYDDWGTQKSLFISPESFKGIFKPVYKKLANAAHAYGLKFFVHSCGYVYDIIEDLIDTGVDVLQFDQPELIGVERMAGDFGGRVTFWCPVDIQKIMQTGDRKLIEAGASEMVVNFKKFKGGFIAKDYPSWEDIEIKDEWAQWARDIFIANSSYQA